MNLSSQVAEFLLLFPIVWWVVLGLWDSLSDGLYVLISVSGLKLGDNGGFLKWGSRNNNGFFGFGWLVLNFEF